MKLPLPYDVQEAARRLDGVVNRTPIMTSRFLNELVGADVYFKCENFQRIGAFKFRGAYNAVSQLDASGRAAGVITHSSGNHAQGVALSAKLTGVRATVVMPEDAPKIKREATEKYGATIIPCPARDRERITAKLIAEEGYTLIHPYDNNDIIAGQGTAALELFEDVDKLDLMIVPVGGGGLISGCSLAAQLRAPRCRILGVEPEKGDDANQSWRQGKVITLESVPDTLADGLRTRHIGVRNLSIMRRYVSDMTTVSEDEILEALIFLWSRMKLVVEPSAAVALAPLLAGRIPGQGQRIGIMLSGGNIDMVSFIESHLSSIKGPGHKDRFLPDEEVAKARPVVLITEPFHDDGKEILRQHFDLEPITVIDHHELRDKLRNTQILLVGDRTKVTGLDIEYAYNLRIIASTGNRLDNIDVSAARAHGVDVLYAPGANALAAAEHTLGLMLQLSSRDDSGMRVAGLAGKTLGIVGFGPVGKEIAKRATAFGMKVIVNQPRLTPELALDVAANVDLTRLLSDADFVSLHVPFKPGAGILLGRDKIALMKKSAYLINISQTGLVDGRALVEALDDGKLAGAALANFVLQVNASELQPGPEVRRHPLIIEAKHITSFREVDPQQAAISLARKIVADFRKASPSETLSLEVLPVEMIKPHEDIDDKRVKRLMARLEADGRLVNPPVVTSWSGGYIVLDGATRFTALKSLGFRFIIAQTVSLVDEDFELHTWYHVISSDNSILDLYAVLERSAEIELIPLSDYEVSTAFQRERAICYFVDRQDKVMLASAKPDCDTAAVLGKVVTAYTAWGSIERTLLTDTDRLKSQFPAMIAVAIFPQFQPKTVFDRAANGELLPAGLTRFVIPGRILRLNADLVRLGKKESLSAKRRWLNTLVEEKLAKSRLRYYSEPVVLLDE